MATSDGRLNCPFPVPKDPQALRYVPEALKTWIRLFRESAT